MQKRTVRTFNFTYHITDHFQLAICNSKQGHGATSLNEKTIAMTLIKNQLQGGMGHLHNVTYFLFK